MEEAKAGFGVGDGVGSRGRGVRQLRSRRGRRFSKKSRFVSEIWPFEVGIAVRPNFT